MLLFKYLSPESLKKVLSKPENVFIRFNYPKFFNDPYELFLMPDEPIGNEESAYFEFFLHGLPQAPVTCFSKRPESVVMWAHYSYNASGACLAINEDKLINQFKHIYLEDVNYSPHPAKIPSNSIKHAIATQKQRHTLSVLAIANKAAYFNKRIDWEYEQERRLIVLEEELKDEKGILVGNISSECIESIIVGPNAPKQVIHICKNWSEQSNIDLFEMHYSRRKYEPFFTFNTKTYYWDKNIFKEALNTCYNCSEPIDTELNDICEWCQITEDDKFYVTSGNQLVLMLNTGLREGVPLNFAGLSPKGNLYPTSK